jgi:transposase InsO family protein
MALRVWHSAAELAALAASGAAEGLPATERGVNARAAREGWDARPGLARARTGRGGGIEYHIDVLPLPARLGIVAMAFRPADEDFRPPVEDGDGLSGRARRERDARLALVRLAERFARENKLTQGVADRLVCDLFNAGKIAVPAWVSERITTLSARSMLRWRGAEASGRLGHDPAAARRGTGALDRALDGRVRVFALAAVAKMPFLSVRRLSELLRQQFGAELPPTPLRTLQRQLASWRAEMANELTLLTDPDGYRSKVEFAATGSTRASGLNDIWQIDASPADVMLRGGRHSVYVAIDIWSRRSMVLATTTPRAEAVGLLMRKCLIAWGVPGTVKTDNGSDFTAHATARLMAGLGIAVELSPPYQPRAKGVVERVIGTFQRDLAGLPGFVGHSVADRKKLEGRKAFAARLGSDPAELFGVDLDLPAFQAWCDDWAGSIYASTPHTALGGATPFQRAASWAEPVRRIGSTRALDVLLAPVAGQDGIRTVTKTGVRVGRAAYLTGDVMPGTRVFVRHDPADLGRVWLFREDGEQFLGEAVAPELAGMDPVETIQRVRAMQKAYVDERLTPIRAAMKKIGPRDVAAAMRAAAAERQGGVVAFPQRAETHATPALDAAAQVARAGQPQGLTGRAAETHAALKAALTPTPPTPSMGVDGGAARVARLPESADSRFRRALEIERRLDAGEQAPPDDLVWLGSYQGTPEYRARKRMVADFGDAYIAGRGA